ncbi:MAG: alpha/beta hydrolase [Campylobacteraceae bacterium]|nr:alpha/beta hydrolase [Campylobacteraceae bacterium]
MKLKKFEVNFQDHFLKCDKSEGNCETVFLHGAGLSSRKRFEKLRKSLYVKGLPSIGFDFIGHGETGGEMTNTSLQIRTKQAKSVIDEHSTPTHNLIGSSMSAYTAIKLTEIFSVKNLVLMVPGIYTPKAYAINFGPSFSEIIRVQNSWHDSDAFEILKKYKGNLLILAAQNDQVIPGELLTMLFDSAVKVNSKKLHIVKGAEHKNLFPHEDDFELAVNMIHTMFTKE